MGKAFGMIAFLFYLLIGFFLINFAFNFINLGFIQSIERWIVLIGGILVIAGGINYLRANRTPSY